MMALIWSHAYTILTLIACLAGVGRSTHPYPLGINFGPGNITAALIQENGKPLLIANIPASDSYRELALESVPNRSPELNLNVACKYWYSVDDDGSYSFGPDRVLAFEEIFAENLKRIRDEVTTVLGHEAQISSISAPSYFNDTVRQAIRYSAADTLGHFDYDEWRISTPEYGALVWFKFHQCQGPGYIVEGAPVEQRYAIFVNMDYDYLELVLVRAFSICTQEYEHYDHILETASRVRIRNMGSKRTHTAQQIFEADQDDDRWQRELRRFWRELLHVFEDFSDAHFCKHNHPYDPDQFGSSEEGGLHFDLLKAIIMSGEAPTWLWEGVRYAVAESFPHNQHRILDFIEPAWVGAVGAAQLAKAQIESPDKLDVMQGCFLDPFFMADLR